jgi:hypothetical protein
MRASVKSAGSLPLSYESGMATVDKLRQMADEVYKRARRTLDPETRRELLRLAVDYLEHADELERDQFKAWSPPPLRPYDGTYAHA